ncbi:MAG: HAMP domain-containing histidine kinase, partial [Clostridia bacterium]|nr:HAMP domain-containing histidine kinase [Clostridia bacterium]
MMIFIISENFLINQTRKSLREEADFIASEIEQISFQRGNISEKIKERKRLKVYGNLIDEQIIVLDNNKKIIYTNLPDEEMKKARKISQEKDDKELILVRVRVYDSQQNVKGHVILFTRLNNINYLKQLIRQSQLLSFIVAGVFSLIIAAFLSRSITKPLKKLTLFMKGFSLSKKKQDFKCNTGDEIENLAHYFNEMTEKIYEYDEKQKSFLQNASHELKTPLMSIQGYAEAIKDGVVEEEEIPGSLNIIIDESQRLKRIVDEIIFLTKVENVEEIFDYKEYMIQDIIREVMDSLNILANENNINMTQDLHEDITGYFDKDKLMRAFINVIANCIRYAKSDVKIEVKASASLIKILIRDDGNGFEAGEAGKIFDRFYKGKNGSTGLGLAITKAVVEGHGGNIKAKNSDVKGALFVIALPKQKL